TDRPLGDRVAAASGLLQVERGPPPEEALEPSSATDTQPPRASVRGAAKRSFRMKRVRAALVPRRSGLLRRRFSLVVSAHSRSRELRLLGDGPRQLVRGDGHELEPCAAALLALPDERREVTRRPPKLADAGDRGVLPEAERNLAGCRETSLEDLAG